MAKLLSLKGIGRHYPNGEGVVKALDGVDLTIDSGEFVAIMGQSGSGKSTLMNILGCLDRSSSGTYHVNGVDVATLDKDGLARLRRETFGFVFQRYNLLSTATAAENVEVPAVYAGKSKSQRAPRALELLKKLGLGERGNHRPAQLSGGQQQRVAIARALMNNAPVILADEPTGALDSASGRDVMQLLKDLHAEGRTIILITHDADVAAHADRQIRIQDGRILDDTGAKVRTGADDHVIAAAPSAVESTADVKEAVDTALRSLRVNIFRTALTLLGIVIGVASVVVMLAVGNGSKDAVVSQISAMGTNMLSVRPGAPGIRSSGDNASLMLADADAVAQLDGIRTVVPERSGSYTLRYGNMDYASSVTGVNESLPLIRDWAMAKGRFFSARDVSSYAPVIVIGQTVATSLFGPFADPVGETILVKNVPFEVVGVLDAKGAGMMGNDQDAVAFIPITTGLVRLFGGNYVSGLNVMVNDVAQIDSVQENVRQLLMARHRAEDFSIRNTASLLTMVSEAQATLTILLGSVAAISLLVGGVGVMNIMLVSVTERTREIGVRMATGARKADILLQFITEAVVVGVLGGLLGVALGIGFALVLELFGVNIGLTVAPSLLAFGCAFMTGLVFGYIPARKASDMDPVVALSTE
ncbi:MAG: macrolide ABC transporter permease/ATP-binding protein MacB [Pseudomonas fluorescens]|nr:MAG: macrolide ABC transporter permease/ATP-binding protein MacB [Pseudomonas fluorescens]